MENLSRIVIPSNRKLRGYGVVKGFTPNRVWVAIVPSGVTTLTPDTILILKDCSGNTTEVFASEEGLQLSSSN
jgi:hypothetical protein